MGSIQSLNRRQKVGIFFTVVIAGFSLVAGESLRQTVGVVLLCLAATWAIGSNSRWVYIVFLIIGVPLLAGAPLLDWYDHWIQAKPYKNQVHSFTRNIPHLAQKYPLVLAPSEGKQLPHREELKIGANGESTNVRMPDGTLIRNVPAGTTKQELSRRYNLHRRSQAASAIFAERIKKKYPDYEGLDEAERFRRIIKDPEFHSLSEAVKIQVLSRFDQDFAALSAEVQLLVLDKITPNEVFSIQVFSIHELDRILERIGYTAEEMSWFSVKWSEAVFSKWVVDPLDAGHCTSKDGRLPGN